MRATIEDFRRLSHDQAIWTDWEMHAGFGSDPPANAVRWHASNGVAGVAERDFYVRVNAGASLAEVQTELADHGQWLPIEAPSSAMTMGEIIAHHLYGPLRHRWGSARDLLLGLSMLTADGRVITAGGQTVKNVAGYDLTRLMVGDMGTLGLVLAANFRTAARPSHEAIVSCRVNRWPSLEKATPALLDSDGSPTGLWWSIDEDGHRLHLRYQGSPIEVASMLASFHAWQHPLADQGVIDSAPESREVEGFQIDLWAHTAGWQLETPALLKLILPVGQLSADWEAIADLVPSMTMMVGLPLQGVIWIGGSWSSDEMASIERAAITICNRCCGQRAWIRQPRPLVYPPIAPRPADWTSWHRMKQALDPQNRLNPHRYWQEF